MNRTIFQFDSTHLFVLDQNAGFIWVILDLTKVKSPKVKTDFGVKASLLSSAVTADVDGVVFMSHTAAIATIG